MLVTKLQQKDIRRNFRTGATTSVSIIGSYAANQSADTFALLNTNSTAVGVVRVMTFATLANAIAGTSILFDSNPSGAVAGLVDPNYKNAIVLAPSVQTGWKAFRIDLVDASLSYLEAGFLFIGTRTQFAYNYAYGAQITTVDPSIPKLTKGGQTNIMQRTKFRRWEMPFDFVTEVQRWSVVEQIDLLNGISLPVLFIGDPSSTNLGRDSVFGLITESSPVVSVQGFDSAGGMGSSKSYKIDQRN
jgi:hypothetical protein